MNERIKELYNQSLEEKYQYGGSDAKPGEMYSNYITVLNPEKFAELIVHECIGCCEQVISDPVPNYYIDTWLNGGLQCIDEIKHHFGVGMSTEDKKTLVKQLLGVNKDADMA